MYVTKERLVKEFNDLIEHLSTISALGIARAAEKYTKDTEEDKERLDMIIKRNTEIINLQDKIEKTRDIILGDIDTKSREFRSIKYKLERYRLEAMELFEEILELDADIDLDNTELDPDEIFGPDELEEENDKGE